MSAKLDKSLAWLPNIQYPDDVGILRKGGKKMGIMW
jgi:hypothetical protein